MSRISTDPVTGRRRRRLLPVAVPVAAALVAVVLGISLIGRTNESAWAADLVRVAEAAPRLLIDDEGWRVTRADQFAEDLGEMTFSGNGRQLDLRWMPAGEFTRLVEDRSRSANLRTTMRVAGATARIFRYEGTNDFTAIWVQGGSTLEARGLAADVDEFRARLTALHEVGVEAWLSAMPDSVVNPADREEVITEMLADMPLPPGFGVVRVRDGVRDRYQLGAQVAGAVACGWIDLWVAARAQGNAAAAAEAAEALATSRRWHVLLEMNDLGDYPEVLWEYAAAVRTDAPVPGGKKLSVEESYRAALGCTPLAAAG